MSNIYINGYKRVRSIKREEKIRILKWIMEQKML
jgi:hypothetical protein